MLDLNFAIRGAEVADFAAQPTLVFKLSMTNADAQMAIHSVALRSQIRIAVTKRRYSPAAQKCLLEVFGEPERWGQTLRDLLWTHASTVVPPFSENITVDLPVACTYDFEVVGTKYFDALEDGEIPLIFLFSGTVFYAGETGNLQVMPISWQKEASYRLPVARWRSMIARYYPNTSWLRLRKDVFDQLSEYKAARGLPTWDETFVHLLETSGKEVRP